MQKGSNMSKTILMIHGMWGGGWYWDKFQDYFKKRGYTCIAPYLRHHDIKPDDPPPHGLGKTSLLDYAEDLELEILASRDLAKAAVLFTPASPAGIVALEWSVLKSFREVLLRGGFWKKPHKISYEAAVYAMMEKLPEEERRYIFDRSVWESGRAATEIGFWFFGVRGAQVDASKLTCPSLIISGSEDNITPAKVVKKVAEKYQPFSTYMEIGGGSHWLIREPGWEKVAAYVHTWLNENVL